MAQDDLVLRGCGNLEGAYFVQIFLYLCHYSSLICICVTFVLSVGEEQAGHNDVGHAMLNDLIDKSLKKEMENKQSVIDS